MSWLVTVDQGLGCLSGCECGRGLPSSFLDCHMASKGPALTAVSCHQWAFEEGHRSMAPGMVGLRLFLKLAPSLMALEVMNTLFACVGQLALALGRDHKCEEGCQPLGCLGVQVAWKVTRSFWSESFSQVCGRLQLEAFKPLPQA